MELGADPPLDERDALVVTRSLDALGAPFAAQTPLASREWRRAAAREAVEGEPDAAYAPSPRSTRGATLA